MGTPRVVHLVWAPLGIEPFAKFLSSLDAFEAGCEYELLIVFNGFGPDGPAEPFLGLLAGRSHESVNLDPAVQDLAAYVLAAKGTSAPYVCFLNSYARVLGDGWLRALVAPLDDDGIGLVGATGSWESAFSSAPLKLRWPRFKAFPAYPNPHIRTNAFAMRSAVFDTLRTDVAATKLGALELESGRWGITRQIERRGLRAVVVGRDGTRYASSDWAGSGTFRSGEQANLLVGDNRTLQYQRADPAERRRLARMCWGRPRLIGRS